MGRVRLEWPYLQRKANTNIDQRERQLIASRIFEAAFPVCPALAAVKSAEIECPLSGVWRLDLNDRV